MASKTELERLASMAHALRPDWPVKSVLTYLACDHHGRAYSDLAVALAYVATDPVTQTPRRLSEAGPWWTTTLSGPPQVTAPRCPLHDHELATSCRTCRAEWLVEGVWPAGTHHLEGSRFAEPAEPDARSLAAGERDQEDR